MWATNSNNVIVFVSVCVCVCGKYFATYSRAGLDHRVFVFRVFFSFFLAVYFFLYSYFMFECVSMWCDVFSFCLKKHHIDGIYNIYVWASSSSSSKIKWSNKIEWFFFSISKSWIIFHHFLNCVPIEICFFFVFICDSTTTTTTIHSD